MGEFSRALLDARRGRSVEPERPWALIQVALQRVAQLASAAWADPDYNIAFQSRPRGETGRFHFYAVFAPHRREDASLGRLQYGLPISGLVPEACAAELLYCNVR